MPSASESAKAAGRAAQAQADKQCAAFRPKDATDAMQRAAHDDAAAAKAVFPASDPDVNKTKRYP